MNDDLREWNLPAGQDQAITEMLRLDEGQQWRLVDWAVRRNQIDARFRHANRQLAVVRILPGRRRPPVEHRHVERFTIALLHGAGRGLLDAVCERVATHGPNIRLDPPASKIPTPPPIVEITDPRELDVETMAFLAGVKPGLRLSCAAPDLVWSAWLFHRGGAAVALLLLSELDTTLMVAPTLEAAEEMANAQLSEQDDDDDMSIAGTVTLGRRLGYPECCVDAFVAGFDFEQPLSPIDDPLGRTVTQIAEATDVWRRLDGLWVARPHARLNSLLFGECLQLISFDPCRMDCPEAAAVADAIFDVLARAEPKAAAELDRLLARPVIVDEFDRRAWVELEADAAGELRIRRPEPIRAVSHEPPPSGLSELVDGQRVDAEGRLPDLEWPKVRVFRFEGPGQHSA